MVSFILVYARARMLTGLTCNYANQLVFWNYDGYSSNITERVYCQVFNSTVT